MSDSHRPALRWHGGKWKLAPWIISHFPAHRVYVEPFGGAASVLIRKPRSYAEIYNDLDDEVVNLFRVLRSEQHRQLIDALRLTPFARAEFVEAYRPTADPVERARRLVVRSFMGFGSNGHNAEIRTGFRANSNRYGTTPAHDWENLADAYGRLIERLRGVVIECRDADKVMAQHDAAETLHYVDPPYMPEARSQKSRRGKIRYHAYRCEMTEADHAKLLELLRSLVGSVVLSGYSTPLYEMALKDWHREEQATFADGARLRTEVLWLNKAAVDRRAAARQGELL